MTHSDPPAEHSSQGGRPPKGAPHGTQVLNAPPPITRAVPRQSLTEYWTQHCASPFFLWTPAGTTELEWLWHSFRVWFHGNPSPSAKHSARVGRPTTGRSKARPHLRPNSQPPRGACRAADSREARISQVFEGARKAKSPATGTVTATHSSLTSPAEEGHGHMAGQPPEGGMMCSKSL